MDIETDPAYAARRKERDEKLQQLLVELKATPASVGKGFFSSDVQGIVALFRLHFDILLALYQDVGW